MLWDANGANDMNCIYMWLVKTCSFTLSNFKVCPPIVLWSFSCFLFDHLWPCCLRFDMSLHEDFAPPPFQTLFKISSRSLGILRKRFPPNSLIVDYLLHVECSTTMIFFAFRVRPWLKYETFPSITCWKFAWLCFKCIFMLKCLILCYVVSNQLIELLHPLQGNSKRMALAVCDKFPDLRDSNPSSYWVCFLNIYHL